MWRRFSFLGTPTGESAVLLTLDWSVEVKRELDLLSFWSSASSRQLRWFGHHVRQTPSHVQLGGSPQGGP